MHHYKQELCHPASKNLVTPLLKKNTLDAEVLQNYQPVSNLSFISKLLEQVVACRLSKYKDANN